MKYCTGCGNPIGDNAQKFCTKCGAVLQAESGGYEAAVQNGVYVDSKASAAKSLKNHPMKWFKFLIYFALFFGAFFEFIMGINYFTGSIYSAVSNDMVSAEMVYGMYGTPLERWDVIYGLTLFGIAVFSIITRFALSGYKKNGPKFLYVLYIAGAVLGLIYNIGFMMIIGVYAKLILESFGSVIMTGIIVFANYKYFSKRRELFCN